MHACTHRARLCSLQVVYLLGTKYTRIYNNYKFTSNTQIWFYSGAVTATTLYNTSNVSSQEGLKSFEYLNLTVCFTQDESVYMVFNFLLFSYLMILVLISFLNNRRIYSQFKDDVLHSFRALILAIFPLVFQFTSDSILVEEISSYYNIFWWMSVLAFVVFNIITQLAMFSQMVS